MTYCLCIQNIGDISYIGSVWSVVYFYFFSIKLSSIRKPHWAPTNSDYNRVEPLEQ